MTREAQLVFCKQCTNREFNMTEGVLCKLTGKKADFENTCPDYEVDKTRSFEIMPNVAPKPNKGRAALAIQLLWAVLVLDVFSIVSDYMQFSVLQDLLNDIDVTDDALNSNDLRVQLLAILYLIVYLIAAITFIQWFRRAYFNLSTRTNINHDEGWAAGGWFVPIISLFRPYRIMSELFEKTHKLISERTGSTEKNEGLAFIGIWWGLWILVGYIGNYSIKGAFKSDTLEDLSNGTIADIVLSVLNLPLGILAILIVTAYAKKEDRLLQLETEDQLKLNAL